ncbi:uncharacterized protein C6orf132 homolog [Brienomyrus brachyistius]|uniref:uncharacterized protein C6orf132 homolog n=1 Tax=Brienomyrus brachyistius TaxID=42636 RepID=UPI0020B200B5|nr:uncharacterized protein C6orf132 homolog [Brienomyrus brachyistius]
MKKGHLNFLGKKNQSLFDSKITAKETENVSFSLDTSSVPESGTAKVRARPRVKHYASSSDLLQGLAVPTPKVPIMPPVNGLQTFGEVNRQKYGSRFSLAVPGPVEGEIFIPPPPSVAPPPPPTQSIPPPPELYLTPTPPSESLQLASLQPPPMPPPKPPVQITMKDDDLASLRPPAMPAPKAPSSSSGVSLSGRRLSNPPNDLEVPEHPKFAPPQPPTYSMEQLQIINLRTQKVPPPKPMRFSSMPSQDGLPSFVAPAPPSPAPTPSSFNPQNMAKVNSSPKTTLLNRQMSHERKAQSVVIVQDITGNIPLQQEVKDPKDVPTKSAVPPSKPARRNSSGTQLENDIKNYSFQATLPSQAKINALNSKSMETTEDHNPLTPPSPKASPKLRRTSLTLPNVESSYVKPALSSERGSKHGPYSHMPQNNMSSRGSVSPMALLMAAKEREKQRTSLTRGNSSSEPSTPVNVLPSESRPNSFTVVPRFTSSSGLTDQENSDQGLLPGDRNSSSKKQMTAQSQMTPLHLELPNEKTTASVPFPSCIRDEESGEDLCTAFIPPPPEFANEDDEEQGGDLVRVEEPSKPIQSDTPTVITSRLATTSSVILDHHNNGPVPNLNPSSQKISQPPPTPPPLPVSFSKGPPPPPKPKSGKGPKPPSSPVANSNVVTKPPPQVSLKTGSAPLSTSQATLLSILQKKMLEMDQKHVLPQSDNNNEEWGSHLSDEEGGVPLPPKQNPAINPQAPPPKTQSLDLRELESQMAKRALTASTKPTSSDGPQSKHPAGLTFAVRPGSKQPITLISKNN